MINKQYVLEKNIDSKNKERTRRIYTPEIISFIAENNTNSVKELSELIFIHFGIIATHDRVRKALQYYKIRNTKEKSNASALYSECIYAHDYTYIKVKERGKRNCRWVRKHRFIYESANGAIPENSVVCFIDGNRNNFRLDNLLCVSREIFGYLNIKKILRPNISPDTIKAIVASLLLDKKIKERESDVNN